MATNRPPFPGLHRVTIGARVYHYAWRGGPRIAAAYGTAEFAREFAEHRAAIRTPDDTRFSTWVRRYRASDWFATLSPKTKANWAPKLVDLEDHFALAKVSLFLRADVRKDIKIWRGKWAATPRMADVAKQVLSRVLSFMVEEGVLHTNPCDGLANLYRANRADTIWREDDLAALCRAASPEIGWSARLGAYTGLRQGDLLRLPWTAIDGLAIQCRTAKSKGRRRVLVPLTAPARELLAAIPRRAITVLTNTRGEPWKSGFSASWNDAMTRAGLAESGLHFHDLRGTAATNFYRAGLTSREIADIMGWAQNTVEDMLDRYVRRDELLLDRIRKIERLGNGGL